MQDQDAEDQNKEGIGEKIRETTAKWLKIEEMSEGLATFLHFSLLLMTKFDVIPVQICTVKDLQEVQL